MSRTLFIAINLPEEIKTALDRESALDTTTGTALYTDARHIPKDDWHITIKFLGNKPEEQLTVIAHAMQTAMQQISAPSIRIQTLTTAPPHRPPRMVWATTTAETNKILGTLKASIEKELAVHAIFQEGEVFPAYHGHITLTRLPEGRKISERIVSLPQTLSFQPKTVDLMESHLESAGVRYTILKSIDFKPSI